MEDQDTCSCCIDPAGRDSAACPSCGVEMVCSSVFLFAAIYCRFCGRDARFVQRLWSQAVCFVPVASGHVLYSAFGSEKDFFEEHRYRSNDFFILSRTAIALGLLPLEDSDGKDLIIGVDNEEAKEALLGEHAFELKLGKNDWVEYSFTLTDNIIKVINYEKMSKLYDFDII